MYYCASYLERACPLVERLRHFGKCLRPPPRVRIALSVCAWPNIDHLSSCGLVIARHKPMEIYCARRLFHCIRSARAEHPNC
jgi:hypothetical protein